MTATPSATQLVSRFGTAGFTVASIGAVYAMTQKLINSSFDKKTLQISDIPPNSEKLQSALPTVPEGPEDDSDGALPVLLTSSKKSSSLSNISLSRNLQLLKSLLGIKSSKSRVVLAACIAAAVVVRSVGDMTVHSVTSKIDELIIKQPGSVFEKTIDKKSVLSGLITQFLLIGVPLALVQQIQNFASSSLSSNIRKTLVQALMKTLVLSPHNLGHPEELVDSNRLEALLGDINHVSVLGVQLGCERLRRYTDILVQLVLLVKVTKSIKIPAIMLLYLGLTVSIVTRQKMFKSMFNKKTNEAENVLKKYLSRLSRHRDSIAAWDGASAELDKISSLSAKIEIAKKNRDKFEFLHSLCSSLCSRVGGTALGFLLIGLHFVNRKSDPCSIFEYFWTGRVVLQLCNSFSSVVEEDVLLKAATSDSPSSSGVPLVRLSQMVKRLKASLIDLPNQLPPADQLPYRVRKTNMSLCDVTALTTEGSILFQSMSFEISPSSIVLVQGSKGSGKTALLRLMIGTWPAVMGEVSRPKTGVYCVLSKPYLLSGASLKEQIMYPDSKEVDNEQLSTAVKICRISHLFEKESRLGSSVLTEQDQQKLMIARMIYHRPKYALFDDCFKALDIDHFASIVNYLTSDCQCGVVIACPPQTAEALKNPEGSGNLKVTVEVILSNKQPPRHEIIINK